MRYLLVLSIILLAGCYSAPEREYLKDPKKFKTALAACPGTQPSGVSCKTLTLMHRAIVNYGTVLQSNPQAFGQRILQLQSEIEESKDKLAKASSAEKITIEERLQQQKELLAVYMMTVRIYEQPEV